MFRCGFWPQSAARARHWLRLLLLCALFSAVHAPLGAWVVSSITRDRVIEVCTSQGPQWRSVDEAAATADDSDAGKATPLQTCVWAAAHLAIHRPWVSGLREVLPAPLSAPSRLETRQPPSDHARRVLLAAAMRAPPVRV